MLTPKDTDEAPPKGGNNVWKSFTLNISLVVLLFILSVFIGILLNNESLINSGLETSARSHFMNIVLTRKWNAQYGGVYVEKTTGMESNPYLENPDIKTIDGKVYTKKNPALMTREISEIAEEKGEYKFHITSLKPLNPNNTPDEFEKTALESFEEGTKEVFEKEKIGGKVSFRYMGPLYVEKSCMKCHAEQGYEVGDVRGGISVRFDITDVQKKLALNRYAVIVLCSITVALLLYIIFLFIRKLRGQLLEAHRKIEEMAITDELTQLHNRRHFFEKLQQEHERSKRYSHPLSCIMMDIDYFKKVNDMYGHTAGDIVLKSVAEILKSNCRKSDSVARYGGEEFINILTETDLGGALIVAERIRSSIESNRIVLDDGTELKVTVSLGVANISSDKWEKYGGDSNEIVKVADEALYRAKENGRNRVEYDKAGGKP